MNPYLADVTLDRFARPIPGDDLRGWHLITGRAATQSLGEQLLLERGAGVPVDSEAEAQLGWLLTGMGGHDDP